MIYLIISIAIFLQPNIKSLWTIHSLELFTCDKFQRSVNFLQMNEELIRKVELLEEYVQTLEKENFAKNGETSVLYEQLKSICEQNQMLKSFIETMRDRWQEEKRAYSEQMRDVASSGVLNSRDYGQQLRDSVNMTSLKEVAEQMQQDLDSKDSEICELRMEKDELERSLVAYKTDLAQMTQRFMKSEDRLRKQLQTIKSLEEEKYQLRKQKENMSFNASSTMKSGTSGSISFAKLQVQKLVKQNNELIEKVRILEKEKNGYYNQLKSASPLKMRSTNREAPKTLLELSRKKSSAKGEKWNTMEEKLRSIRLENERLKANLAIE